MVDKEILENSRAQLNQKIGIEVVLKSHPALFRKRGKNRRLGVQVQLWTVVFQFSQHDRKGRFRTGIDYRCVQTFFPVPIYTALNSEFGSNRS